MSPEPPSHVLSEKSVGNQMAIGKVVSFELGNLVSSSVSCRRQLACSVGGMLNFLHVHQKYRSIHQYGSSSKISRTVIGPTTWIQGILYWLYFAFPSHHDYFYLCYTYKTLLFNYSYYSETRK